jgi:membrane-bound serine protease (ClpP class)
VAKAPLREQGRHPFLIESLQVEMRIERAFCVVLAAFAALLLAPLALAASPRVLAIEFENDVNPVTADYVTGQLERANEERFDAVVILLDTPGGLADSMRQIYREELASKVPVLVYVAPDGARAASAGVWIGQAADVLAMAPQTNLGSSTPVAAGGGEIPSDLKRKVVNDAAASLRALAEEHGRNGDWAERAVRQGANLTARAALRMDVIDEIAPTLPALLERVHGERTQPKGIVLRTAGARIERVEMGLWKRILDTLIDPNIITLMLSLGALGIVVELWNPGLIFPGTVGAISLVMGLYGLQVLPVSFAGILLMLLAAGFFVADLFVTSHGALTLAGAVSFVFGALLLFDPAGPAYQVSLPVALAIAGTIALFMVFALAKVVQVRRRPVEVGLMSMVGSTGVVRRDGYVLAHGELWRARSASGELVPGQPVAIEGVDGLVLEVRPLSKAEPAGEPVP